MKCTYCNSEWQTAMEVKTCPFCGKPLAVEPPVFSDIAQALRFTLDTYQAQINKNPNTILAYLSDLTPKLTNERRLLKMCADAGILAELLTVKNEAEKNLAAKRATAKLRDVYFLDAKWAETAVEWITAAVLRTDSASRGAAAPQTQQERIQKRREELKKYAGRILCSGVHILGLRSDGTVIAYGVNDKGQCNVGDWRNVTAIACNLNISAGLVANQTILCTNTLHNRRFQLQKNIVQIAVQRYHPVALCADGTVVGGSGSVCLPQNLEDFKLRHVTAIACNWDDTYGLLTNGIVKAYSDNICFKSDDFELCDVKEWKNVVSVVAPHNADRVYGIRKDGLVYARGNSEYGQCDVENWQDVIDIVTSGFAIAFALKSDGSVVHTGKQAVQYQDVSTWTDIVALACGSDLNADDPNEGGDPFAVDFVAGLKADGTVMTCGSINRNFDTSTWRDIVAIACGWGYVVGLRADGTVLFTGKAMYGEDQIAGQNLFR